MDCGPRHPSKKAADPYTPGLQDGKSFADDRHVAFVEVAEWTRCRLTHDPSMNQLPRITSLLHRHLSDSGQRLSVLLKHGGVAHDENFWMSRYGEIVLHFDSSRVIRLSP